MSNRWQWQLIRLARAQAERDATLEKLIIAKAEIDQQITAVKADADQLEAEIKQAALDYVAQTGDTKIHPLIEFRRTTQPQYDEQDALSWSKTNAQEYVIFTERLDKRAFNKAVRDGNVNYPGAEMVSAPTIAIKDITHLLEGLTPEQEKQDE
jgi:hypothetical protein